jgi:hypothetical protein
MELYIAEYLVENGFANDMVSALKILHVASDDWYDELINEDQVELAKIRREIQQLIQRGKPVPQGLHDRATELAKQANISAKVGAELNKRKPKPKRVPGRGEKPQKGRDVIGSGTISGVMKTGIYDPRTGRKIADEQPSDVLTGGRYADRRTAGGRGTNRSRTGGTYGTRGSSR